MAAEPVCLDHHPSKREPFKGNELVKNLISNLDSQNKRGKLVSVELSAASVSYLSGQFTCHIPYKIGLDPSPERLIEIGGLNESGGHSNGNDADVNAAAAASPRGGSAAASASVGLNLFGRRSKLVGPGESASVAANGLIEGEVDPFEFVSALLTLHNLLGNIQHLRLTGNHWPVRSPANDEGDTSTSLESAASSAKVLPVHQDPIVDMSLFPNVTILEVEAVPPEAIINIHKVYRKLRLLKLERFVSFLSVIFICDAKCRAATRTWHSLTRNGAALQICHLQLPRIIPRPRR